MSHGIQIAASGMMTALYRQDVHSNNLANINTIGFKADVPTSRPRPDVIAEDGVSYLPSDALLRKLGGGTALNPTRIDFSQGSLRPTGNDLDIAIQGEGFLAIRSESSTDGDRVRLTRDGRLSRDRSGRLVLGSSGLPLADTQGNVIHLADDAEVKIDGNGVIRQRGTVVAQLQFVQVADPQSLQKIGGGLLLASGAAIESRRPATGTIHQGHIEESGVDEIRALMAVTGASRDAEMNAQMIQQHDRLLDRAINGLGRVTA